MKREPEADETLPIDEDAFVREGIRLSENEGPEWRVEERTVEVHSIQRGAPEDRKTFDMAILAHSSRFSPRALRGSQGINSPGHNAH
jgi:hypothetical protein